MEYRYELDKDPWYTNEIAHLNYKITYNRPDPDREIIKDGALTDIYYIKWTDTMNQEGYVAKNQYHKQDYYPKWISEDQMEFEGKMRWMCREMVLIICNICLNMELM